MGEKKQLLKELEEDKERALAFRKDGSRSQAAMQAHWRKICALESEGALTKEEAKRLRRGCDT